MSLPSLISVRAGRTVAVDEGCCRVKAAPFRRLYSMYIF
jgi:hypothetical protein